MGNRLCCAGSWSSPSTFKNKNKADFKLRQRKQSTPRPSIQNPAHSLAGSQARCTLKRQQQQPRQNSTKGHKLTGHKYEQVLQKPVSQKRSQDLTSEENNLHYADIQVFSRTQPRSASEVKHLQLENATEYATLYFPQPTRCYDSKNGTLV
ncbi:uncharacterized protein C11orf52 homolog isoform X2 [Heterocephalus glaber]|uniref:Uncharacterized protein C11orf52 homolog isoform X2 n=1 Tax=Heterocephalus glaber TaxID=10181 RepID=A0AAX6QZM8_HETGA|nr:uncharacterized protein C11orf52 homolog isoform X2 [Heterocephalus glaber]